MSDTRPRPRPRPRPKPKAKGSNDGQAATNQVPSTSSTLATIQSQDEDALFMRNTTRTSKTWKQLEELDQLASVKQSRTIDSDGDSPTVSPRRRNHKRKSDEKGSMLPKWEKDQNIIRFLSKELSESDSEDIQVLSVSPVKAHKRRRHAARSRSRSRSITPPPALPIHQLQNARNVVRQTLAHAPRPASPTAFDPDESTDTIILAPELAQIAQAVQSQSHSLLTQAASTSAGFADESSLHATGTIMVRVRWQPHPMNQSGRSQTWVFKMNRDDTFHTLFDEIADSTGTLTDNLRLSYNGVRMFASVTPDGLEMPLEAELVACDRSTLEYLRKQHNNPPPVTPMEDIAAPGVESSRSQSFSKSKDDDSGSESDASNSDTFKLILRSSLTKDKDITLMVRPTTKCGAIVKAFLKKAGLSDQYPSAGEVVTGQIKPKKKGSKNVQTAKDPKLSIDGDIADNGTEIETFDLEDGDQVEVVGL